jgi:hypothetical protein
MRDQAPDRLDQSRIRVHEEPERPRESQERVTSQQRIRKHTVLGMPSAKPAAEPAVSAPADPAPSGSARGPSRVSQKTMLGIPRPEVFQRPEELDAARTEDSQAEPPAEEGASVGSGTSPSHRLRARVRYDSADEPFPVVRRRRRALGVLAVLVLMAAAWLGYRFFTVHG